MNHFRRFGRRVPIPSSLQIVHELRLLSADENARQACAESDGVPGSSTWDEIIERRLTLARSPN